jgi:two-component system, OmpR family, sensor kinase
MFGSLRRRITRGYVLLAVTLILVVVVASTALAFLLYARGMNDAIGGATQRVADAAARSIRPGHTLEQAAPQIINAVGRSRFHVLIVDDRDRPIAQNEREGPPSPGRAIVIAVGRAVGLPRARVTIPGGHVIISADFDRFGELLLWYWEIMLPIGLLAVIAAWLIGRRITSRAIGPLADVTEALRVIAAGDFTPQRLLNESTDLSELTAAYNDVAYSLATASAERAQTEAQMRQFIADAGHELRTPLTIIMGYLDVLRQGIIQGAEGTQHTYETMLDESRKMRALIEKLILLARLDRAQTAVRPVPIDLAALAQRVVKALEPLANGRIQTDLSDEGAIVTADESELYEAVKNVVDNALKYSPGEVRVGVKRDDRQARVTVSDSGPGMDPQDLEHAFDRFYRGSTRAEIEGTGLGLAIAKRAAERAGGSVSIESEPGHGTRVVLCLPRLEKPAAML